ncbi:MAG: MFS transporter [Steroidobacteraceae bacterium]
MKNDVPAPVSGVRWRVLALVMAAGLVSYLLRGNLSIAAPAMMADLHLSELQWGWVMSAFPLGYALFQFPGGLYGERVGSRRAIAHIAIAWGLLIAVTALVPGPAMAPAFVTLGALVLVQFLVGAAHAPVFPVIAATIERWFPVGAWGLPNGLTNTGLTVGLAATASLLPWLIGSLGWRESFLALAPTGLAMGAAWWWYVRDRAAEHPAIAPAELALIRGGRLEHDGRPPRPGTGPAWLHIVRDGNVLRLTASYACMNFVFYLVFSWGYYYLVTVRGYGEQQAGFLTSLQWLGAGAGAALGGWACDRQCRRLGLRWGCRWTVLVGMTAQAVLLIGVAYWPDAGVAAAMLGLCFFFNQACEGSYWNTVTAVGGRHAGPASGVMNTGANLMGFVNALMLAGIAQSLGWAAAIAIGAVFALAGAGLILTVRADEQMDQSA